MVNKMREEYDIENLNPRKNPYTKMLKQQITINIETETVEYFKELAKETGISYQNLINLFLSDCKRRNLRPDLSWT